MTQENTLTFEKYINRLFTDSADKKACRREIFIALTSYILRHEHINLVSDIHNPATVIKLANKYADDETFMQDKKHLRSDCLRCLDAYAKYLQETQKQERIYSNDGLTLKYPDDEIPNNRLF